ncbi:50S ribosomal protein L19 [Candidatus Roizmanbacteria bacterium]|nr:50S ribosomal protein L19 [Candidatus Roizmanbacteria bacterium]
MANSFLYKETRYKIGDTVSIDYKLKEGDKERIQIFKGIITKVKGDSEANRMFTVRKISKVGIGVEKIIPLLSPYIAKMELVKKSSYQKAKLYFIKNLTEQEVRTKLYQVKKKNTHEPLPKKSR